MLTHSISISNSRLSFQASDLPDGIVALISQPEIKRRDTDTSLKTVVSRRSVADGGTLAGKIAWIADHTTFLLVFSWLVVIAQTNKRDSDPYD
jgi:hypothetical protein